MYIYAELFGVVDLTLTHYVTSQMTYWDSGTELVKTLAIILFGSVHTKQ